jgi:general stress protein 26
MKIKEKKMKKEYAVQKSLELIEKSSIAMLGSIGKDDYPYIKGMMKMSNEGLKTVWFSTNTSSNKIDRFRYNPKASVYFVNFENFMGLMLLGEIEIFNDLETKKRFWIDGFEKYYTEGVDDPDYTILRFTAKKGNLYHNLDNLTFDID